MTSIERYNYAFDPDGDAWAARILRRLPATGDVLELGPGPGAMSRVMRDKGHAVVAVESDSDAVRGLRDIGVEAIAGDLNRPDWSVALSGRRFDSVLACDVLEHLLQPEEVLRALTHHVQPAGKLLVSIPNIAYAGVLASLRTGVFDYTDKGQLDRTHLRFFTRRSFQVLLLASGWIPVAWEANRIPLAQSEFAWHWDALPESLRVALASGWDDFDVYQWMVEAVPAGPSGWQQTLVGELNLARSEGDALRRDFLALQGVHQIEHASLLEHQKAFAEAKEIIQSYQSEIDTLRQNLERLRTAPTEVPNPDTVQKPALTGWRRFLVDWLER